MHPCSLCGANAINPNCIRCELRMDTFSDQSPQEQMTAQRYDQARTSTRGGDAIDELVERFKRLTGSKPPIIGLLGCGKQKLNNRAPVRDLYTGNLFRAGLEYAEGTCDETYVLSASYGLLDLDRVVLPYNKSIVKLTTAERRAWGRTIVSSLVALFPTMRVEFCVLAGTSYADPIIEAAKEEGFSWVFRSPLKGLMLGQRLRWFKELRRLSVK